MNHSLVRSSSFVLTLLIALLGNHLHAEPLRYAAQSGQKFSYRFEITVDAPDEVISYQGITTYTVQSVSGDQIRLQYLGGLNETSRAKDGGPRRGFHRFPDPPRMAFDRQQFAGKSNTTNQITLTTRGDVVAMEGDSQLPYLIGNVSLLPFEPLPETEQSQWTTGGSLAISQSDERRDRFSNFGFLGAPERPKMLAATEETTYQIKTQNEKQVVIYKTSRTSTPAGEGHEALESQGSGTWTFDPVSQLSAAMDYQSTLQLKQNNIAVSLPITIKFELLTEEELAKIEAERKASMEAAAKAMAEAKAEAERPLTAPEKKQFLDKLASGQDIALIQALNDLARKQPKTTDEEIIKAIEPLLNHSNAAISMTAKRAMSRWSPEYERKQTLAESYRGPGSVPSSNLPVEPTTKLFVGQILQVTLGQNSQPVHRIWYPAAIEDLLADGTVKVARLSGERPMQAFVVARSQLQLAPSDVVQPAKPAEVVTSHAEMRTWTDISGRFKLVAVFVGLADSKVSLRGKDGRVIIVPLEKLCKEDQAMIQKTQEDAENPFAQ